MQEWFIWHAWRACVLGTVPWVRIPPSPPGRFEKISSKKRAVLTGIFILIAYGVLASIFTQSKIIVMLADSVSGAAVIGIALLIFPLLKDTAKKLTISYLSLKILEGGLMIAGGLFFLVDSLQYIRDWVYNGIHLYSFIISGFIFYYLLYKSLLVPGFISVWGMIAVLSMFVTTILKIMGISNSVLDSMLLLIVTNEVFLAVWLIVKGFNGNVNKQSPA